MFRRIRRSIVLAAGLLAAAALAGLVVARAAELPCPAGNEVLYATAELRISCTANRQGRPALLLTNLDEDGERLSPEAPDFPPSPATAPRIETTIPAPAPDPDPGTHQDRAETVAIVLRNDDGSQEERTVEVHRKEGDAPTIVINIDNRQSPPPAAAAPAPVAPVTSAWPWAPVVYAGLPGPYVFPEHYHFLGASHDNSYPRWFGGLAFGTSRYASLYSEPEKPCPATGCPPK